MWVWEGDMRFVVRIKVQWRTTVQGAIRPHIQHLIVYSDILERSRSTKGEEADTEGISTRWIHAGCEGETVINKYLQKEMKGWTPS